MKKEKSEMPVVVEQKSMLAIKQAELAAHAENLAEFGDLMDETPVDKSDFLIPKLLLMQSVSVAVQEERARAGEIRESIDNSLIAKKGEDVEIIPFHIYKTWNTFTKQGNEWLSQVPITLENYNKPREEILQGGLEVLNFETLNYYCILPQDIQRGMFTPYVISFRSTSYMAGKALETHRAKLKEFGLPLPFKTFKLGMLAKKNDKGNFYVYTIKESRDTLPHELEAVKHWNGLIKAGDVKVDESELEQKAASHSREARPEGRVDANDLY